MPTTGEKPGKGKYICAACGQRVILDDDTDRLPPCPTCSGINYNKGVKTMAKPVSPTGGTDVIEFWWKDDMDIHGWIDMDNFMVFDMEDHNLNRVEEGKSKGKKAKIGHTRGLYKKLGKQIQTLHIREKDKIKEKKGG